MRRQMTYLGLGLLGGLVGATAGVLLAPASGRELRRRLSHRLAEEKEALLEKGHLAFEGVTESIEESRRVLGRIAG
jgi:gas vesicle protein